MNEPVDRIVLRGLRFEGHHGVSEEERAAAQPVEVDLGLSLDLAPAAWTDDLTRTVDYSTITRQVGRIIRERQFRLIESIAQAIADDLLATHPSIDAVEVRVHKPRVRLGEGSGEAAVEIRRGRRRG